MCPVCEKFPDRFVGYRGGKAHRQNLGVECKIWRCRKCGLLFPNPMPFPLNGIGQHYDVDTSEYFRSHDVESRLSSANVLLKRAEELIGGAGKLLDIGAGRGELLRSARERGWSVVGIEPSDHFADYAIEYSGAEIKRTPVEESGFQSSSFDAVILASVLEHLYNPGETIKEISRILKPGGMLYLDVPNENGLYFRAGNLYQRVRGRDWVVNLSPTFSPYHVFGFNPRALRALLGKHRLQPVEWRYYAGVCCLPSGDGPGGRIEHLSARILTTASIILPWLGTYIETWARKN